MLYLQSSKPIPAKEDTQHYPCLNSRLATRCMKYCKNLSENDQEIPQSQTADNPVAPRGRAAQPSRDTRKTN